MRSSEKFLLVIFVLCFYGVFLHNKCGKGLKTGQTFLSRNIWSPVQNPPNIVKYDSP